MNARDLVKRIIDFENLDVDVTVKTRNKFKNIVDISCDINGNLIIYLEDAE